MRRIHTLIAVGGDTRDLGDLLALEALPQNLARATTLCSRIAGDLDLERVALNRFHILRP